MYKTVITQVWPEWKVCEKLGEGTYGSTYKVEKAGSLAATYSVVKVIAIPRSVTEETVMKKDYPTQKQLEAHLKEAIDEYIARMKVFEPFRYNQNLVRVEEYKIISKSSIHLEESDQTVTTSLGWFILIRMNYVMSVLSQFARGDVHEKDVINLGIDICNALEICESCKTAHGNVKPENIFLSSMGKYQLADFAITDAMEKVQTHLSKKRLPGFLAPETYHGDQNSIRSDLYSLGLVMFRFLNKNKLPFQDLDSIALSFAQKKDALDRRFRGDEIPKPVYASDGMAHILQKACAFSVHDRYQSPAQFREQLEALLAGTYSIENDPIGNKGAMAGAAAARFSQTTEGTVAHNEMGVSGGAGSEKNGLPQNAEYASIVKEVSANPIARTKTTTSSENVGMAANTGKIVSKDGHRQTSKDKDGNGQKLDPFIIVVLLIVLVVIAAGAVLIMVAIQGTKGGSGDSLANQSMGETIVIGEADTDESQETSASETPVSETTAFETTASETILVTAQDNESTQETFYITETTPVVNVVDITTNYPYTSLAANYESNFKIGVAASTTDLTDERRAALIKAMFNSITAENATKPDTMLNAASCQANPADYNEKPAIKFSGLDQCLAFAQAYGMKVRFHTFVWYTQTPEWFFHEDYDMNMPLASRELMLKRLESYMKQTFDHIKTYYPDIVYACDVANETIADDSGNMRTSDSLWYQTIGEDYIHYAFTYARQYAPDDVKLFLNDYNEYAVGKCNKLYEIASELKEDGLIDGIGLQSHMSVGYPSIEQYKTAVEKLGSLGLELQVTELDIGISAETPEQYEAQAKMYKDIMSVLVEADNSGAANITSVTVWGLTDDKSWRSDKYPLLFDQNLIPKKAYDGFLRADSIQ